MATPTTWWLLPVLLVTLPYCGCSAPGPPAAPFNLECFRPCDQEKCSDIKCIWDSHQHPDTNIDYTLHWKPENAESENVTEGSSADGIIHRVKFESHGELCVWVQAQNQYGSVKSQEIFVRTQDIIKPPPPTFISTHQDPLEIHWSTICDDLGLSSGDCYVRYRSEEDQNWIQHEDKLSFSYAVMEPKPGTDYEFQVRCQCASSLISDWSESEKLKSAELAPVGEVDAWWDCEFLLSNFDCFLNWKNLSFSQARGHILGYEVTVLYNNGTVQLMNVSTDNPSSLFVYDEMKWRLTFSLKNASFVTVSAYNALGATKASRLPTPTPGKQANDLIINLEMNQNNLTVSWNVSSKFPDSVKQYVVQYKECLPGNGSDWIKVDKNQTTAFFKGVFKKYTSYRVSLFALSNLNEVTRLATARGYSAQGVPSPVLSFKAAHLTDTEVTLFWQPVPSCSQKGVILSYHIGVNTQQVYKVNVTPDHGNMTYKLQDLSPGQEYRVWIRAETAAGPGENVTTTFKSNHHENYADLILIVVIVPLVIIIFLCGCKIMFQRIKNVSPLITRCLYEKVPDPSNSHIFKQMKHQINEPLTCRCGSLCEPYPSISVLEVVEIKPKEFKSDGINKENVCHPMACQDDQREDPVTNNSDCTDNRYGRKEYSKMVDSDEDKNDCWSSSEEEQSTSGYEKHFMPSPMEIMVE